MSVNSSNNSDVKVSVVIVTYNQMDYIKEAIESVISQKTDFQYEIIIHDDASDDGTSDIVREYSQKYDNIIPLIETQNQYSAKGYFGLHQIIQPYINGTYIIALEGDDYWCDDFKLQKQVDFLDTHPDYVAHTHSVKHIFPDKKIEYSPIRDASKDWSAHEIIDWEDVFHASSLMYKSSLFLCEFNGVRVLALDYILACWLIFHGKIAYSQDVMSVHTLFAKGSFTKAKFNENGNFKTIDARLNNIKDRQVLVHKLDELSEYKYHDSFVYSQERRLADYYAEIEDYKSIIRQCKNFIRKKKLRSKIWLYGRAYAPWSVFIYEKLRRWVLSYRS